ncbi:MAG: YidC/Oxa1 family membrane protein insertase [Lachnospiraceae bacterium]|nr:YidC/Oxa1 family membrane protein insertase [Lachnospiraceae bacterium]MBD5517470.1 YidC/Oxa1 family membrane protein insertase [Lachnospiraceae bacterium]
MSNILLTQDTGKIIGPVAKLLGYIMEGIFYVIDKIGIPNIGLAIILFTIVIYLLLMPLTIKQQKFSKLSAKMNPELQAIQAKYKNKKDNDSMMAMNMETKAVYAKYGVSPSGSCVQLLIQMPILLALYRVIYNIPAYVGKVKEAFFPLVDKLIAENGSVEFIQNFSNARMYTKQFENENFVGGVTSYVQNTFVDVLNKASSAEWISLKENFSNLSSDVDHTLSLLDQYNNFLGLSMSNSPAFTLSEARAAGSLLMMISALIIPILAAVTQWINVKLMPQQPTNTDNEQQNTMVQSMKTMNMVMPIMSAVFCYTLPAGMGLYWVAGAVVRSIQQVLINKHIDKMDLDEVIKKNEEKAKKKMEKANAQAEQMAAYANMNTKKVGMASKAMVSTMSQEEKDEIVKKATENAGKNAKPGSMMAKANMVRDYNEKNNK